MKRLKKLFSNYFFNVIVMILLAVLVLFVTVRGNDTEELLQMFRSIDRLWLVVLIVMVLLRRALCGLAIKLECNLTYPHYRWIQGIQNSFTAGFFNGITPSSTGGQFAQVYVFRKQGIPMTSSIGVLWMDFIIYQSSMILSVLVLIVLKLPVFIRNYSQFYLLVLAGFVVNSTVIALLWALVRYPGLYTWISTRGLEIGMKLHLIKDKETALAKLEKELKSFGREVEVLRAHHDMIWKVAGAHVLRLFLYYATPAVCALALNVPVRSQDLLNILALSSFVSMVSAFVPLPGASGGAEATFVLMFSTLFGKLAASSIMILWRFSTYYLDMLIGAFVFLFVKYSKGTSIATNEEGVSV